MKVDIERAAQLWAEGRTAADIAELFGCTVKNLLGIAGRNRAQFPSRAKGTELPPVYALVNALTTRTVKEVAEEYGVSPSAICVKLRRAGGSSGKAGRPPIYPAFEPVEMPRIGADRVVRKTFAGALITLPRIPSIDGHFLEAAE